MFTVEVYTVVFAYMYVPVMGIVLLLFCLRSHLVCVLVTLQCCCTVTVLGLNDYCPLTCTWAAKNNVLCYLRVQSE